MLPVRDSYIKSFNVSIKPVTSCYNICINMFAKFIVLLITASLIKSSIGQHELQPQIYQSDQLDYPIPIRTAASYAAQNHEQNVVPVPRAYKLPLIYQNGGPNIPSSYAMYSSSIPATYFNPADPKYEHDKSRYLYKYGVSDPETGDKKTFVEEKDSAGTTRGEYSYVQPDGTLLTVTYSVNGNSGFNAIIKKSYKKEPKSVNSRTR